MKKVVSEYVNGINGSRVKKEEITKNLYYVTVIDRLGCKNVQKFNDWKTAEVFYSKMVYGI